MKSSPRIAILCLLFFYLGCNTPRNERPSLGEPASIELKVGGIYAHDAEGERYILKKILAADDSHLHIRLYREVFDELPTKVTSEELNFVIGHIPMTREGFLLNNPQLITVETVDESELAGYKLYLKTIGEK